MATTREYDDRTASAKNASFNSNNNVKSRLEEKEQLSDLNDRLATYIDRMRSRDNMANRLSSDINQERDELQQKAQNMKALYEKELNAVRKLLDDTSKENAQLKVENAKLNSIAADISPKLQDERLVNKHLEGKIRELERNLKEKEPILNSYAAQKMDLQDRLKKAEDEIKQLDGKLAADKHQLDKEVIGRVDAENRLLTLREEMQFQKEIDGDKLKQLRDNVENEFKDQLDDAEERNKELQDKYEDLEDEYNILVDSSNALDAELEEYDKLLGGEEQRMKLKRPKREHAPRNSEKRPRTDNTEGEEEPPKGKPDSSTTTEPEDGVVFGDVDVKGGYVSVVNKSNEAQNVGGYFVHRVVDGKDAEYDFKFPTNFILRPQQRVIIWSRSHASSLQDLSTEFVMRGNWSVDGINMETIVVNTESDILARHVMNVKE